jgi:hypothetical protein
MTQITGFSTPWPALTLVLQLQTGNSCPVNLLDGWSRALVHHKPRNEAFPITAKQ